MRAQPARQASAASITPAPPSGRTSGKGTEGRPGYSLYTAGRLRQVTPGRLVRAG